MSESNANGLFGLRIRRNQGGWYVHFYRSMSVWDIHHSFGPFSFAEAQKEADLAQAAGVPDLDKGETK